jgi:hypothetical protein
VTTQPSGAESARPAGAVPQPSEPTASPAAGSPGREAATGTPGDSEGWPQRQITVLGQIQTDTPQPPVPDERGLETQDAFIAYERETARRDTEGAGALPVPGPLLEGPGQLTPGGYPDTQSPAEEMRRLDEIAELRQLIGRIEAVPADQRGATDRAQYAALWYRLGIITSEAVVVDSALSAVQTYTATLTDEGAIQEWTIKQQRLRSRLAGLPR